MWSLSVRHSQSHGESKVNTEAFRKQSLTESELPTSSIVTTYVKHVLSGATLPASTWRPHFRQMTINEAEFLVII